MKIKLTSSEGGKLRLGSMVARQLVRGLEALIFCLLLSLLFYLLNHFDHIGLKIFVSMVMLAVLGTAGVAFIKPGLHNILSSSFVSDVSLFFNKQSDYFRQDA